MQEEFTKLRTQQQQQPQAQPQHPPAAPQQIVLQVSLDYVFSLNTKKHNLSLLAIRLCFFIKYEKSHLL